MAASNEIASRSDVNTLLSGTFTSSLTQCVTVSELNNLNLFETISGDTTRLATFGEIKVISVDEGGEFWDLTHLYQTVDNSQPNFPIGTILILTEDNRFKIVTDNDTIITRVIGTTEWPKTKFKNYTMVGMVIATPRQTYEHDPDNIYIATFNTMFPYMSCASYALQDLPVNNLPNMFHVENSTYFNPGSTSFAIPGKHNMVNVGAATYGYNISMPSTNRSTTNYSPVSDWITTEVNTQVKKVYTGSTLISSNKYSFCMTPLYKSTTYIQSTWPSVVLSDCMGYFLKNSNPIDDVIWPEIGAGTPFEGSVYRMNGWQLMAFMARIEDFAKYDALTVQILNDITGRYCIGTSYSNGNKYILSYQVAAKRFILADRPATYGTTINSGICMIPVIKLPWRAL